MARMHGTLVKWNDQRGFGFLFPARGEELFVHASAFPDDGMRPRVGEMVSFDIETTGDGRRRAVQVQRPGAIRTRCAALVRPARARSGSRIAIGVCAAIAGLAIAALQWPDVDAAKFAPSAHSQPAAQEAAGALSRVETSSCDGRTRCAQMTSCAEATYFLRNCPKVQLDGDHDGVPCEQQWCTR